MLRWMFFETNASATKYPPSRSWFRSSSYCNPWYRPPSTSVTLRGCARRSWTDALLRGTCGIHRPTRVGSAGKLPTTASAYWYAAEVLTMLFHRASQENSTPVERRLPRLLRCRVIRAGVVVSVRLETGSSIRLQKYVPLTVCASEIEYEIPASEPICCSERRSAFESVRTLPTRKLRYSSFRVGARNAREADAWKLSLGVNAYESPALGLANVSSRSGKLVNVRGNVGSNGRFRVRPLPFVHRSTRTPPVSSRRDVMAMRSSTYPAILDCLPPLKTCPFRMPCA